MSYLNVIPNPAPLPSVHGLGAVRIPVPRFRRRRGMGQTVGCQESGFDTHLTDWLNSLSAMSPNAAAVGCGPSGGAPCTNPTDAANMALIIAGGYCNENSEAAPFGCPVDPACSDGGVRAAAPYVAQALAFFSALPASVWQTEAADLASGQYYGAAPTKVYDTPGASTLCAPGSWLMTNFPALCTGANASPVATSTPAPVATPLAGSSAAPVVIYTPAASSSTPVAAPAASGSPSPAAASGSAPIDLSFLTNSMFAGIPNWWLLVGVGALFMFGGKR